MTEEQLNELSIFALRELARQTGVYAPTSKKKGELIKEIIEISEGKKKPYVAKTKQGRPPKGLGYPLVNVLMSNNNSYSNFPKFSNTITLNQEKAPFNYDDIKTLLGYVEILGNNTAYLWTIENYNYYNFYLPMHLVNEHNLKSGDKILAEIESADTQIVVKSIFNINDCPILKYDKDKRKDFYNVKNILPKHILEFNDEKFNQFNFKMGENIYLYGSNNNQNTLTIIDLLNSCKIKRKIYINISLAEKNKLLIDNLKDSELFVSNITDSIDKAKRIVALATERIKRLFENDEYVLVAVDDIMSLSGIDDENMPSIKNLVSLSKDSENAGAISLFAIMPADKSINLLEKLADKRIKICEKDLLLLD